MNDVMLKSALHYHNEGLCVIPIVSRGKKPALPAWEQYHTRMSTTSEIYEWFTDNGYNVGIVHGPVSDNFVAIDIDHDQGIFEDIRQRFPLLVAGRIEQSGSLEGYHIPLKVTTLPDFGQDSTQQRQRGNRTWKTHRGNVNVRIAYCQTVVPPSIHPTGNRYKFLKKGDLARVENLNDFISWLDGLDPPPPPKLRQQTSRQAAGAGDLVERVLSAWVNPLEVFTEFGLAHTQRTERNGEIRLLGNGGLLVTEDQSQWYCFSDEIGGGVFEAWGWCRFGSRYDKHQHFRQVLEEMARAANIDLQAVKEETAASELYNTAALKGAWMAVLVEGEPLTELLGRYKYPAVGINGKFDSRHAGLFGECKKVFVAFDPDQSRRGREVAAVLKRQNINVYLCQLPVSVWDFFNRYGGDAKDFFGFLNLGKKL